MSAGDEMSDCSHKTYHRIAPDQPYTCMACGAPEEEETERRRYEYKTATWVEGKRLDGSYAPFFHVWLNEHGAEGWHLSAMVERSEVMAKGMYCVFARRV